MEAEGLDADEFRLVLINGVHGTYQSQVKDGDRLALFPPIAGG
jgi:molybdopterin converting factor small subunit